MEGSNGFHRDSMSSSSRENISNILQQLRHRASVLITFVGYVQNNLIRPTETAKKLSDVEVRMM